MKILLISGSYPPQYCGIGDYTSKIAGTLKDKGADVTVLANINWSLKNIFSITNKIKAIKPDVIHIQYPSIGYGLSLVPQILSIRYKTIVTIHEVSQAHWLRKLALIPFSFRAKIIFTNEFEKKAYKKLYPWTTRECYVIPIGSNISAINSVRNVDRNFKNIIYFGQIRPEKGLEEVINLAKLIKEYAIPYNIIIAGQLFDVFKKYYDHIKELAGNLPINWMIDSSPEKISNLLSSNFIAYLPFPDGASYRRGSLFAAIENKMLVFTTKGVQTSADIINAVYITNTTLQLLDLLRNGSSEQFLRMYEEKREGIEQIIRNISWAGIAEKHILLYGGNIPNIAF